jgi:membrane protein implicated in regulation of membrane protease activity
MFNLSLKSRLNPSSRAPQSKRGNLPNEMLFTSREHYQAKVKEVLRVGEEWYVLFQGGLWRARPDGTPFVVSQGQTVLVTSRSGNVLFVVPLGG